jgi:hypothetical protein
MTKLFATRQWETAELLALTHCSIVATLTFVAAKSDKMKCD